MEVFWRPGGMRFLFRENPWAGCAACVGVWGYGFGRDINALTGTRVCVGVLGQPMWGGVVSGWRWWFDWKVGVVGWCFQVDGSSIVGKWKAGTW